MSFPSIDGSVQPNPSIGQYGLNTQGTDAGKVGEDGTIASKTSFPLNGPSLIFSKAANDPTKLTNTSTPIGEVKELLDSIREAQEKLSTAVTEFMNKYDLTEEELYKCLDEFVASWKKGDQDPDKTSGNQDPEKTSGDQDPDKTSGDQGSNIQVHTNSAHQKVMFDAFALLALMLETAQKERNASREIRLSQNLNIQQAIVDQADMQRYAAIVGLVFGAISCVISVAQFAHNSIQTGRGMAMEKNQRNDFNVGEAATEFKTAQTQAKPVLKAQKDLANATETLNNSNTLTVENKQAIKDMVANPNATEQQFNELLNGLPADSRQIATEYKAAFVENKNQMDNGGLAKLERYNNAKGELNARTEAMKSTEEYKTAINLQDLQGMRSMAYTMVSRLMDNIGQGWAGIKNAEATEEGAAIKGAEEQLEQIKDIFKQYDDIIQNILATRKSIVQAESEAIRSIFA